MYDHKILVGMTLLGLRRFKPLQNNSPYYELLNSCINVLTVYPYYNAIVIL